MENYFEIHPNLGLADVENILMHDKKLKLSAESLQAIENCRA